MSQLDEKPKNRTGEFATFKDPDTGDVFRAKIKDQTDFIPDKPLPTVGTGEV